MTSINGKMGLRPAGKRSMMKLPDDRAFRAQLTAARCPACHLTGARVSRVEPGKFFCEWCNERWTPALK